MSEKKIFNPVKLTFFIFIFALSAFLLWVYGKIIPYIISGFLFAYILNPVVSFLERKGFKRISGILLIYLLLAIFIFLLSFYFIPMLFNQIQNLASNLSDFFSDADWQNKLKKIPFLEKIMPLIRKMENRLDFIDFDSYRQNTVDYISNRVQNLPAVLMNYLSSIVNIISFIVTIPVIGFFLLKDKSSISKYIISAVPNRYFELVIIVFEKIDEILGSYLRALMTEIIIVAVLSAITLSLIGVKYSLIIGLLAGFANAIPYFGPLLGLIFAVFSVLFSGKSFIALVWVIIGMQSVQFIDNNIIYPLVMGKNTEMHPLVIMLTVMAGGYAFGLIGMFLSVPAVFLIKGVVAVLYKNLKEFEII
ncbi:MAG: hypothetical protein CSB55_04605 [Candidatus Cloacimonadota bacterium]|nr:MAG: hypothetical protein CSB55_04605 [Candidatus Cloacimonadota bacterium]